MQVERRRVKTDDGYIGTVTFTKSDHLGEYAFVKLDTGGTFKYYLDDIEDYKEDE